MYVYEKVLIICKFYYFEMLISNFFYRKLVEKSKIDEQNYSYDDQAQDNMLLDAQKENKKMNAKFYVRTIL